MNPPSLLRQAFVRLFLAALTAALFATLASCGGPTPNGPGLDALSSQIDALTESITDSRGHADQLAFWQIAVACLVVLAGFALIAGAALGSIARRENTSAQTSSNQQPNPQTSSNYDDNEELR